MVNEENYKAKKIPPINIFDINTKQLIDFVKNGLKINEFQIKEFRNKKSLFLNNIKDFMRVKAFLEKTETKFFTFTPKDLKIKTYLLKGLDENVDTDEILFELLKFESDDLKFIKVTTFSTKLSKEKGIKLPMFLVQVSPGSNVNKLKNIKTLLYRCIKWEQLKRPEIPQCYNCQGFFHSAANCYLPARCVKCSANHERGKCPMENVTPEERNKLFCVLCNKFGHPASYKGCEKYKILKQKLISKKKTLSEKIKFNNQSINTSQSFANIVRGSNTEENVNVNNLFMQEIKNLMINMNTQITNLQKQLDLQVSRIDAIFSMLES